MGFRDKNHAKASKVVQVKLGSTMWQYILYAILAALGIWGVTELIKISWDVLRKFLYGKRIAILGARAVGKTHLIQFLTKGTIPLEYEVTIDPTREKGRKLDQTIKLADLNLKIDDMIDFSGGEDWYPLWKEQFDKADIVFYLFKANDYFGGDKSTQDRVHQDLGQIDIWFNENKHHKPTYFLVGTHCDFISGYVEIPLKNRAGFSDKLIQTAAARNLKLHVDAPKIILGSMEDIQNTEELAFRLFYRIEKIISNG